MSSSLSSFKKITYTHYYYLENKMLPYQRSVQHRRASWFPRGTVGHILRWTRKSFVCNLPLNVTIYSMENGLKGSVRRKYEQLPLSFYALENHNDMECVMKNSQDSSSPEMWHCLVMPPSVPRTSVARSDLQIKGHGIPRAPALQYMETQKWAHRGMTLR